MQHEYPLIIVEEIARAGSIRGAADILSITPSALNRRLLGLENELNTQLFERTPNGVILNAAGEIFITHARRQLADMKSVHSKIADIKGARRGRVVIAVDDNVAILESIFQEVAHYQQEFNGVTFVVEPTPTNDIAQALTEYYADLAVQLHPTPNSHVTSLCTAPVQVHVVARKGHPALGVGVGALRLHELAMFPWALPASGPLRDVVKTSALRQNLNFRIGLETSAISVDAVLQATDTVGFEVSTIGPPRARGLDHRVLSPRDQTSMFLHLSQLKGRSLSVAAGRFTEQVRKSYAQL